MTRTTRRLAAIGIAAAAVLGVTATSASASVTWDGRTWTAPPASK